MGPIRTLNITRPMYLERSERQQEITSCSWRAGEGSRMIRSGPGGPRNQRSQNLPVCKLLELKFGDDADWSKPILPFFASHQSQQMLAAAGSVARKRMEANADSVLIQFPLRT